MADALISKEHFYLNGSIYNKTDTDQDAVILIEDTNDILQSSDDWLVHVTRFSCDAMKSLTYVEKDESATWTIRVANNLGEVKQTYVFVLDQDFATPQAHCCNELRGALCQAAGQLLHQLRGVSLANRSRGAVSPDHDAC